MGIVKVVRMLHIFTVVCFLSGCAWSPDRNILFGWGKVKRDTEGKVVELESQTPIQILNPTIGR